MTKELLTLSKEIDTCSDTQLLRHIAHMLAVDHKSYADEYLADNLRYAIMEEMIQYDHKSNPKCNCQVTVQYGKVTESATFRASDMYPSLDKMSLEDYVAEVVTPISRMLTKRILSQVEHPYTNTFCNIEVTSV